MFGAWRGWEMSPSLGKAGKTWTPCERCLSEVHCWSVQIFIDCLFRAMLMAVRMDSLRSFLMSHSSPFHLEGKTNVHWLKLKNETNTQNTAWFGWNVNRNEPPLKNKHKQGLLVHNGCSFHSLYWSHGRWGIISNADRCITEIAQSAFWQSSYLHNVISLKMFVLASVLHLILIEETLEIRAAAAVYYDKKYSVYYWFVR